MFTLKQKEKNNNLDFKGKIYFDYIIKLFFLFIINEFYFITITTKWGINIFLKVDGHLYSFIIYVLLGFYLCVEYIRLNALHILTKHFWLQVLHKHT